MYLKQDDVKALLGRSLNNVEEENFQLYYQIAVTRLEDLLCRPLADILTELDVEELPVDLKLVLARLFGSLTAENASEIGVEKKDVEDFSISYNDDINKIFALTVQQNAQTIMKYAKCCAIRNGRTLREDCLYYDNFR